MLQNVSPYAATISWWADDEDEGQVIYSDGKQSFALRSRPATYQKVRLTGLKPDTVYTYRLEGNGYSAGPFTFRTAPLGNKSFRFAAYGDTRTQHDIHREIVEKVLSQKPALALHTGDLVADGREIEQWEQFFQISQPLIQSVPLYPALGNHEMDSPLYFRFFSLPGNERYYSFDWGACHFICLNSNEPYLAEPSQLQWLQEDLQRHKDSPYIVVFFHNPPHTLVKGREEGAQKVRQTFSPILEKYQVSAVFLGHDHNYQHFYINDIHYIVVGGGGAPLYDVSAPDKYTIKSEKVYNYVIADVGEEKMVLRAYRIDGSLIEKVEIKPRIKLAPPFVKMPQVRDRLSGVIFLKKDK